MALRSARFVRSRFAAVVAFAVAGLGAVPHASAATAAAASTERISVDSSEKEGISFSNNSSVSADGRFVVFDTGSALVKADKNSALDVYVRDRQKGTTSIVSVSTAGVVGNTLSDEPTISANGRFVAFESDANNLVGNDGNFATDVFVRDLQAGKTTRVSVDTQGKDAKGSSHRGVLSADGRFVAFDSIASDLVAKDTNGASDVFVRDLQNGKTTLVSVSSKGVQGMSGDGGHSSEASISSDGRYVAFSSRAVNLVSHDTNGHVDVFVHDRSTGKTTRVSVLSDGSEALQGDSTNPSISGDGSLVAFDSTAFNLVDHDNNEAEDVFLHEMADGTTTRISVSSSGKEGLADSSDPSMSANGRFVAFTSDASNLVTKDQNEGADVFVRDLKASRTSRASVNSSGGETAKSSFSYLPAVSSTGRFVTFASTGANLVQHDGNGAQDVFLRDRA
jgi:Tol biopolymer transport system component